MTNTNIIALEQTTLTTAIGEVTLGLIMTKWGEIQFSINNQCSHVIGLTKADDSRICKWWYKTWKKWLGGETFPQVALENDLTVLWCIPVDGDQNGPDRFRAYGRNGWFQFDHLPGFMFLTKEEEDNEETQERYYLDPSSGFPRLVVQDNTSNLVDLIDSKDKPRWFTKTQIELLSYIESLDYNAIECLKKVIAWDLEPVKAEVMEPVTGDGWILDQYSKLDYWDFIALAESIEDLEEESVPYVLNIGGVESIKQLEFLLDRYIGQFDILEGSFTEEQLDYLEEHCYFFIQTPAFDDIDL